MKKLENLLLHYQVYGIFLFIARAQLMLMVVALPVWPTKITVSSIKKKKQQNNIIKQQQSALNASNMLSNESQLMKIEIYY